MCRKSPDKFLRRKSRLRVGVSQYRRTTASLIRDLTRTLSGCEIMKYVASIYGGHSNPPTSSSYRIAFEISRLEMTEVSFRVRSAPLLLTTNLLYYLIGYDLRRSKWLAECKSFSRVIRYPFCIYVVCFVKCAIVQFCKKCSYS